MNVVFFNFLAALGLMPLDVAPEPGLFRPTEDTAGWVTLYVILGVIAAALVVFAVVFIIRKLRHRKEWWKK